MKRISLLVLAFVVVSGSIFAQEADTSKVRIGKKKYTIIVDNDKDIQIITDDEMDDDQIVICEYQKKKKKPRRMDGTWEGFELGLNNFVNADYGLDLPADAAFMETNLPASWGLSFNFAEKSLGLVQNYFGLVTGMGLEFNQYRLANDIKIAEVDGLMTGLPVDLDLDKNRLTMGWLNIPLMAEVQIPVYGEYNRLKITGGVIGGLRLYSRQVQKYQMNGDKQKMKIKDGFNFRDLRYGFTARVAYGDWALFANYYPQTLFKDGMGPDIYPVTVGIHIGD